MVKIGKNDALLVVDVQNDFIPGGALPVGEGDRIVPTINELQKKFDQVIATQDYHPADHGSFAANHSGKNPGEFVQLAGLNQILWPVHCVQGSTGADFHPDLNQSHWKAIFRKGKRKEVDSYSGFFDNARRGDTGLGDYLRTQGVNRVFICALALDYCVKFTALDAQGLGFDTFVISDATRAVNLNSDDGSRALKEMAGHGIRIITSSEL